MFNVDTDQHEIRRNGTGKVFFAAFQTKVSMEPGDETLMQACRQGEAAAWEALIARYQRLVYSIPRRAGLDEDQTADVFQHVFAMLLNHLHHLEQPGRVRAWIVTTARRATWRAIQKRNATVQWPTDDDHEAYDLPDDAPLPAELITQLEEQHLVRTALTALDERCRRLLTLLFYQPDLPQYADIASSLGMPEGSIGPTRARCLRKLRRLLDELEF
jgi:RNA polymerase sigma factor (sigma-70 family)